MKRTILGGALAVALAATLAGCGDNADTSTAPMANTAPKMDQMDDGHGHPPGEGHGTENTTAPDAPKLGSELAAGPFKVMLTMNPVNAKAGDATFTAKVTRDGKPVTNAKVMLKTSMPTMGMPGPDETLKHTSGGAYEGKVNLGMGGYWQGDVEIEVGKDKGVAAYGFTVVQK